MTPKALLALIQTAYDRASGEGLTLRPNQLIVDELALDSLQQVEILCDLEQALEIEIVGDKRLHRVKTIGDLIALLTELTASSPAAGGNDKRAAASATADTH